MKSSRSGPRCSGLEVGDHVVFGFIPSCGRCPSCATGHQNLCDLGQFLFAGRQISDMTARHHARGQDLGLMCLPRHVRRVHRRQRGELHQDREGHPARQGRPRRLRRHDGMGLGRVRGRRAARRVRGRHRLRRRRDERRAGRSDGRRPSRRRRRPGRVQARAGAGVRGDALGAEHRGGHRARQRPHVGRDGEQGHHHRRRRRRRADPARARVRRPRAVAWCTPPSPHSSSTTSA